MKDGQDILKKQLDKRFEVLGHSYSVPHSVVLNPTKEKILIDASMLFALNGYDAVSIRDIAEKVGITSGALYNHYDGKGALLDDVLDQAKELHEVYYKHLDECLRYASKFDDVLDIIFLEPVRMRNEYTIYVFSLVITEQVHNKKAGEIYNGDFLGNGIAFMEKWLSKCVERGWVKPFDTKTTAHIILNNVLASIVMMLHHNVGNEPAYSPTAALAELKEYLRNTITAQ
jgi:AcrR family transcriptional regulator